MPKSPLVSVIVPCYNHAKYLPFCIESILKQDFDDFEIIIVNDASTDNSLEVANKLAKKDKRIIVLDNKNNMGCIKSDNRACKIARGKYINLFSADDGMIQGNLRKKVKILEYNPNISLVFSEVRFVGEMGNKISDSKIRKRDSYIGRDDYLDFITYGSFISTNTMIVRRDSIKKVGFQLEDIPLAAEWNMQLLLLKKSKTAYLNEPLVFFRVHENNLSKGTNLEKFEKESIFAIEKFLSKENSNKTRKLIYGSLYYSLAKGYYNKRKFFRTSIYLLRSLFNNPKCFLLHLKKNF